MTTFTARTLAVTAILFGTSALTATAEAATPGQAVSGYGWKLIDPNMTTSLTPTTYTVEFDSLAALVKLTPYLKAAAHSTNAATLGVNFAVSTTIQKRVTTGCQKRGTIVVSLEYQPVGKKGVGWGGSCFNTVDHTLFSGVVRADKEWWYPQWFSTNATTNTYRIRNAVTHEFGHAIGLGHPNKDLDRDGVVESYECPKNYDGYRPLMCAPNGGRLTSTGAGNWTPLDVAGLKALVSNYKYR